MKRSRAVLVFHTGTGHAFENGSAVIRADGDGYAAFNEAGSCVARSCSAKALATWTFDAGATFIHHDYDLRKAAE